jgi:hypothetical protein
LLVQHRFYVPYPPNLSGAELDLFKKQVMAPIQIKVCSVLKNWIEEHWLADFAYVAPAGAIQKALDREHQAKRLLEETKAFLAVMSQDMSAPWAAKTARVLLTLIKKKEAAGTASTLLLSGAAVPTAQLLALGAEPTRDRILASVMEIGLNSDSLNGVEFPKSFCRINMTMAEFDFTDCDELEVLVGFHF